MSNIPRQMTVGGMASRLAAVTGQSESFHARQLRGLIRQGALVPAAYGGEGQTAAALFDDAGLARAMVLHVLASLNLDFGMVAKAAPFTRNLDSADRPKGKSYPADPMVFAIERIQGDDPSPFYFHVGFEAWPAGEDKLTGYLSSNAEARSQRPTPKRAVIVLPLHTILGPLFAE